MTTISRFLPRNIISGGMVSLLRSRAFHLPPLNPAAASFLCRLRRRAAPLPRLSRGPLAIPILCLCARSHMDSKETFVFGPYPIDRSEVFYSTPLSYAMVNLRPLLPDVLVCPRREVKRFVDLSTDETSDLWLTAKEVGGRLERFHGASSLTFAIQDGPQAGQTVPHVHVHILPRKGGDFQKNDEIYDAIDVKEKALKEKLDLDKERKDRTSDEMAREADEYRALFS